MENILFNITYTMTILSLLLRILCFFAISGIFLFLIYLGITKISFYKKEIRREISIRLAFLWAIFIYLIVFNTYLGFLFYKNGIDAFIWTLPVFYKGILAQLITYISLITLFGVKYQALKKIINDNSIN